MPASDLHPDLTVHHRWRQRYARFLLVCVVGLLLLVASQSLGRGLLQFDSSLWGRNALITFFTQFRLGLKDRVFSQVVVGPDGWLQYTAERNLDDYQNAISFSPKTTQRDAQLLYTTLQARHILLMIVIVPNKATIYPESVPAEIRKLGAQSRLDVLRSYFKQYGPPVLIDLRASLKTARLGRALYYKTDSHWNALGAFVAYTEIMQSLSRSYPALTQHKLQEYNLQIQEGSSLDLARLIGATSWLEPSISLKPKFGPDNSLAPLNNDAFPLIMSQGPDAGLPALLMYHDSFGLPLEGLLAPHFRAATFIQNNSQYPELDTAHVMGALKPDIIIIEIAERYIDKLDGFLTHYEQTVSGH